MELTFKKPYFLPKNHTLFQPSHSDSTQTVPSSTGGVCHIRSRFLIPYNSHCLATLGTPPWYVFSLEIVQILVLRILNAFSLWAHFPLLKYLIFKGLLNFQSSNIEWLYFCHSEHQAEALRDTFPASDKSLSKLLGEVPYLPEGALKVLEGLCSPSLERSNAEKHDKETPGGDRITQGLSCVWSLILLRPTNRDRCLQIALEVCYFLAFIIVFQFAP